MAAGNSLWWYTPLIIEMLMKRDPSVAARVSESNRAWLWLLLATILAQPVHADATVAFRAQGILEPNDITVSAVAQREIIQEFLGRHPEITIERFAMPNVHGTAMDSGPLMAIAAGIPPHAIYVNFRISSTYIEQGFLEPLEILLARMLSDDERTRQTDGDGVWRVDPHASEIEQALALIRSRVPARAWEVVYREDESGRFPGKHVWAMPTKTLVAALLYRKDLFYEAGLDPERPPETWDEFLDMARDLTVPQKQQYGLAVLGGQSLSWGVYALLVSNNARAVERGDDGVWRACYDSRAAAESIEYICRLAKEPFIRDGRTVPGAMKIATSLSELDLLWRRGQVAMQFSSLRDELLGDQINPQIIGIAPVPLSPRGTRGSELNCEMLGVYSGSTPRQQLAVMQYIEFITSEEAQRIRTRVYVDHGFGEFVSPDLLEKFGYERLLRRVPTGWKQAFNDALANGVPEPYGRNTQHIYRYMSEPIYQALELDFANDTREQAIGKIHSLLTVSVDKTNIKIMGHVPTEQMRIRRIVAGLVVAALAGVFIAGGVLLWRFFTFSAPVSTGAGRSRIQWASWALLAPALLLTLGWLYVPLGGGLVLAFTDYRLGIQSTFVGLDNFAAVLYDTDFWKGLARTIYFVALMIVLGFWPPILLALLLDEIPTATLKYLFRTLFYLPAVISGVIIMFLWKQLYDPTEYGVLNQLLLSLNALHPLVATVIKWLIAALWLSLLGGLIWLQLRVKEMSAAFKALLMLCSASLFGVTVWLILSGSIHMSDAVGRFDLKPLRWIESPMLAMFCVVLPTVWAGAGPGCLLYLAALKTVPGELYEAADIDGAGIAHKVFYITLPRIRFLIGIQFVAAVVAAFKGGTDYILALTGGGPNDATMILALEIFIRTFMDLEFGIGAAMAWLLGLLLVGFTAYQLKMLTRVDFSAAPQAGGK